MKLGATIIAIVLGGTIAHAEAPKQAPAEVTPTEAQRWVALFDKVVETVVTEKQDCPKMAGGINTIVDDNQPVIAMARDAKARGKRLPVSAQQHMMEAAQRMVAAMDKCGRDERVAAAFRRLDLGSHQQ